MGSREDAALETETMDSLGRLGRLVDRTPSSGAAVCSWIEALSRVRVAFNRAVMVMLDA